MTNFNYIENISVEWTDEVVETVFKEESNTWGICYRDSFNEVELEAFQCEYEPCCEFEGKCPMREIEEEFFANFQEDYYDDYDSRDNSEFYRGV